jgi:hypothetical protein
MLLPHLDGLVVASDVAASELALTRLYLDTLEVMSRAHRVAVGVIVTGHEFDSGLAPAQLERRLRVLPLIGRVPRLWGRVTRAPELNSAQVDAAFAPVIEWILALRSATPDADAPELPDPPTNAPDDVPSRRPTPAGRAPARYQQAALLAPKESAP